MRLHLRLTVPLLIAAVAALAVASAQGAKSPSPPGRTPKLTITPQSATFGPVAPDVGEPQEFVLGFKDGTTSGGLSVAVGGVGFEITADTCTGTAINTSNTCAVTVTYTPSGYGESVEGTLTATGKKDVRAASALLFGSSTAASLVSAAPSEIAFGEVESVGGMPTWVTFTNNATVDVKLAHTDWPVGFAAGSSVWQTCEEAFIAPGDTCWGAIGFTAAAPDEDAAPGYYEGQLTTTWVDSAGGTVSITKIHVDGTLLEPSVPGLSINDAPWVYSNDNAIVIFTVTMNATSASDVTFEWIATDSSAYWGNTCDKTADYTSEATTGNGTITAGQTTTTITFGTCNNGPANVYPITTPTYFTVTISNPAGATITSDTGTAEIRIS